MSEKHPLIGKVLAEDYKIVSFLGKGGMGSVFVAEQLSLNRQVAIKLLPALDLTPEEMQRFEYEIATMATLNHPNIVMILHRGKYGDSPTLYYVMELLEGGSLKNYLHKFGKMPPSLALHLIRPVAEALTFAHEQGCIHRDIKPDNLLFTKNYRSLKIADFGIAKLATGISITNSQAMVGTFLYAAPEQMKWYEGAEDEELQIDERADQYSLGVVLYEMVTGQLPYKARNLMEMMKALSQDPIPLSEAAGYKTPKNLDWVIAAMISKSRESRFMDDETLLDALASVELELTASVSTRIFSLKNPDSGTGQMPMPLAATSEKVMMQSMETMTCVPPRPGADQYKKLATIGIGAFAAVMLVFGIIWLFSDKKKPLGLVPELASPTDKTPKVTVRIVPMYEPPPPPNYPALRVVLISQTGPVPTFQPVQMEDTVLPGKYELSVILPGYESNDHGKSIEIRNAQLFHLSIGLRARPRKISPKIVNTATGEQVMPLVLQIDHQPMLGDPCRPGERHLYAVFENYQEIDTEIAIPAGEETFQIRFTLVPLKDILFALHSTVQKLDGSPYPLDVLVDGKQVYPVHLQYQIQNDEIRGKLKVAPSANKISLRQGFYQTTTPVDQLYLVRALDDLEPNLLLAHLFKIQDKKRLLQEIAMLVKRDKSRLQELPVEAQDKLYQFLVAASLADPADREKPIGEMRRLVNRQEAEEYQAFQNAMRETASLSHAHRTVLWQSFLSKYPKGVYQKQAQTLLEYCEDVVKYENLFRESVRECFLSLSEKRALQHWEQKLKPEDIGIVKKRMVEYVKKLGCGQSLDEMLKNR